MTASAKGDLYQPDTFLEKRYDPMYLGLVADRAGSLCVVRDLDATSPSALETALDAAVAEATGRFGLPVVAARAEPKGGTRALVRLVYDRNRGTFSPPTKDWTFKQITSAMTLRRYVSAAGADLSAGDAPVADKAYPGGYRYREEEVAAHDFLVRFESTVSPQTWDVGIVNHVNVNAFYGAAAGSMLALGAGGYGWPDGDTTRWQITAHYRFRPDGWYDWAVDDSGASPVVAKRSNLFPSATFNEPV